MNDFLREMLGMTGTKFGCGAAQCLSCAIIVDNPGRHQQHRAYLRDLGRQLQWQSRSARSRAMPRTANCRRCKRRSSNTSRFNAAIALAGFPE